MEKLVIEGNKPLSGKIPISGAKNAALPIMAATILSTSSCRLTNVPQLNDIYTMCKLLRNLGLEVSFDENTVEVSQSLSSNSAPYELVKKMRASVLVLGPLLGRLGEAEVSLPGGCAIGSRPIDLHLSGFEDMGAEITLEEGDIHARADELTGSEIYLDFPSVGATENLMMAAALAEGKTIIENAAREPEVEDLARFINSMGGKIEGIGSDELEITGVERLERAEHRVLPDRIETGTYLVAGAITRGKVTVLDTEPDYLRSVLNKLKQTGVTVEITSPGSIQVVADSRPESIEIVTLPYPGFPTDMQAQFTALLALGNGTSTIKETIFEERFMHVLELQRLGADIKIDDSTVTITGVESLTGAPVMATDLRASAALVLAGLAAEGETEVRRIYHLDRGYENLEEKLGNIGATIKREQAEGT